MIGGHVMPSRHTLLTAAFVTVLISTNSASTASGSIEMPAPMLNSTGAAPAGTSWWFNSKPQGAGTIIGVRRTGGRIQFADNWAPCFSGTRIRGNVYRGGGENQNGYYSRQEMMIRRSGDRLLYKTAFIPDEKLWRKRAWSAKRISTGEARRKLQDKGISPSMFWNC